MKRFHSTRTNRHHRRSRSRGGSNHPDNISIVHERTHTAFHMVFPDTSPEAICKGLNEVWGDPDFHFIAIDKRLVRAIQKLIKQLT